MDAPGVSQGYPTQPIGAPCLAQTTTKLPFTKSTSFLSENDILRDIFSAAKNQPLRVPSTDKRKYTDGDDDDINLSEDDVDMTDTVDAATRPIKPLRQTSKRALNTTQSLPMLSIQNDSATPNVLSSSNAMEEEDWSKENFN